MIDVLKYEDNFSKISNIHSELLFGNLIDNPDFTLAIPIYGCNKYLVELLKNLKEQETSSLRIQIIISDNKVYDNKCNIEVVDLLERFKFENIAYYLSKRELGQYNNFNRCIELSNSKYVAMVHDDDLLVRNYFKIVEKVFPYLNKHPKIGMFNGRFEIFHDTSEIAIDKIHNVTFHTINKFEMTHFGFTLTGIPSCGIIFNKELFIECGGFNDSFPSSGDAFLAGVMVNKGYKIKKFINLTGYYRISINSSLRLDICKGFIIEDELFRETWKNRGCVFRKIYMKFFSRYLYSLNIDSKVQSFSAFNPEINVNSLDFQSRYKKYSKISIVKFLYKVVSKLISIKNNHFNKKFKVKIK